MGLTSTGRWLLTMQVSGAAWEASREQPQSKREDTALPALSAAPQGSPPQDGESQRFTALREETGHLHGGKPTGSRGHQRASGSSLPRQGFLCNRGTHTMLRQEGFGLAGRTEGRGRRQRLCSLSSSTRRPGTRPPQARPPRLHRCLRFNWMPTREVGNILISAKKVRRNRDEQICFQYNKKACW